MKLLDKLQILADSAKYDVSCSSSGSSRSNRPGGVGNASLPGICHSWSDDGRCISLLKILFTNACIYDCKYCINRSSNDIRRASFTPDELCELTIQFYRRNYIEGLFLSSAVIRSPDYTMELMIKALKKLRHEYRFNGYIHLKSIPGTDMRLIHEAGLLADRMSINIELPSTAGLKLLAPQKDPTSILEPMSFVRERIKESRELVLYKKPQSFVPAGQTTQLIVGATQDSDLKILNLTEHLYRRYQLKRVYYSAYVPVNDDQNLPSLNTSPPLLREHRIYQADWLLRFYGFRADELLDEGHPSFDTHLDPKCDWALRHLDQFPVEINKAPMEMLLRVPGIGYRMAARIIRARRVGPLTFEDLKRMRVVLKRARYFITCNGRYSGGVDLDAVLLYPLLSDKANKKVMAGQISMFG
ncbi:MAG: putative DNA modification/repair radical SAM protein [Clostridiaceae bacterium]|jgi:putative DNA modification/repair radical SAM protein|nr:putative DNA modification/repair radical SAM protein [Bacillota bacterium]NLI38651.1 putative DNA modification/repair radical SAM protein [Clostridiaceae bacterium]